MEEKKNPLTFIRSISKEKWMIIGNIILLFLMGLMHALEAGHYANFIAYNGTFQDFNPVRRFLSGQVPYRDFQDYLGLGHLYLGSIFTWILGGKYRASLIAFRFVAFLSTGLIFYVISRITLKRSTVALATTNILLAINLIQPTFIDALFADTFIKEAFDYAMTTGNSARMLRGAIMPISAFVVLKFGEKFVDLVKAKQFKISDEIMFCILAGALAGICFPWSNDYGISSWLCVLLMTFFVALSRTRKFFKSVVAFLIAVIASIVSCFIVVELFTLGHFGEWLFSTFGTGGYQTWYYISSKSYYITDVDFSHIELIQAFLGLFYLVKVWKAYGSKESLIRYGLLAYANLTCFCAVNEYRLLSGNFSREVALIVLFTTVLAEILNYIANTNMREKANLVFGTASLVVCCAWVVSACLDEFNFQVFTVKDGVYVDAMGGYMTELGEDILKTAEFLGDKKTFATYASGQELVSGNFQPSGTDYLIHVLGDKQRENYLKSFENDDFDYAVTLNENYTDWEFWLQRANWFFYESLLENWHPVYANSYEIYWERNKTNESNIYTGDISVRVEPTHSRALKIVVDTDESVSGAADVYIDYEAKKDDGKTSLLVLNTMVKEENTGVDLCSEQEIDYTFLRKKSKEYIPVTIVNGHGEVTLTAMPEKSVYLTINDISCSKIYTAQFNHLYINLMTEDEDSYYLHVTESNRAYTALKTVQYIYIDGKKVEIKEVNEDGFIVIDKSDDIKLNSEKLKKQNVFRVE